MKLCVSVVALAAAAAIARPSLSTQSIANDPQAWAHVASQSPARAQRHRHHRQAAPEFPHDNNDSDSQEASPSEKKDGWRWMVKAAGDHAIPRHTKGRAKASALKHDEEAAEDSEPPAPEVVQRDYFNWVAKKVQPHWEKFFNEVNIFEQTGPSPIPGRNVLDFEGIKPDNVTFMAEEADKLATGDAPQLAAREVGSSERPLSGAEYEVVRLDLYAAKRALKPYGPAGLPMKKNIGEVEKKAGIYERDVEGKEGDPKDDGYGAGAEVSVGGLKGGVKVGGGKVEIGGRRKEKRPELN